MTTHGYVYTVEPLRNREKRKNEQLVDDDFLRLCIRKFKIRGHTPTQITVNDKDAATLPADVDGIPVIAHRHVARNTVLVGTNDWNDES